MGFLLMVVFLYFDIGFELDSLWLRLPKGEYWLTHSPGCRSLVLVLPYVGQCLPVWGRDV